MRRSRVQIPEAARKTVNINWNEVDILSKFETKALFEVGQFLDLSNHK